MDTKQVRKIRAAFNGISQLDELTGVKYHNSVFYERWSQGLPIRGLIYLRTSTRTQHDLSSPEEQLRKILEFGRRFNIQWQGGEYYEDSCSAKGINRPGFMQIAEDLESFDGLDVIVTAHADRMSRQWGHAGTVWAALANAGVEYIALDTFQLGNTFNWGLVVSSANAEDDNRRRSNRIREGTQARMRAGHHTARVPWGFRRVAVNGKKWMEADPDKLPTLKHIFHLAATSDLTLEEIRELIVQGQWYSDGLPKRLRKIIANPTYIGKVRFKRVGSKFMEVIDGVHDAIIDEKLWQLANEARVSPARIEPNKHKQYTALALKGMVLCPNHPDEPKALYINQWMYSRADGRPVIRQYMYCANCKFRTTVSEVEEQITSIISSLKLRSDRLQFFQQQVQEELDEMKQSVADRLARSRKQLSEFNSQEDQLNDDYLSRKLDVDTYNRFRLVIREKQERVKFAISRLQAELTAYSTTDLECLNHLDQIGRFYLEGSESDKKEIIIGLFGRTFHPSRIKVSNSLLALIFDSETASSQGSCKNGLKNVAFGARDVKNAKSKSRRRLSVWRNRRESKSLAGQEEDEGIDSPSSEPFVIKGPTPTPPPPNQ